MLSLFWFTSDHFRRKSHQQLETILLRQFMHHDSTVRGKLERDLGETGGQQMSASRAGYSESQGAFDIPGVIDDEQHTAPANGAEDRLCPGFTPCRIG